jgi:hypothetical protein
MPSGRRRPSTRVPWASDLAVSNQASSCWTLRLFYYGQGGAFLGQGVVASGCGGLSQTEWQQVGVESTLTTPGGTLQVKAVFYAFMNSGWVAVDDFSLKADGEDDNLLPNPGFEDPGYWQFVADEDFPGTSIWRDDWGTAAGRSGQPDDYAVAISNQVYGYLSSDPISFDANDTYTVHAWVRGELDGEDGVGRWLIRAQYYDANGQVMNHVDDDVDYGDAGSLSREWQYRDGEFSVAEEAGQGAVAFRIQLFNYLNSGWVAYDDVELQLVGGSGENLLTNPGFENGTTGWSAVASSAFPGTSLHRGDRETSWPHSGSYAWSISNHAYGHGQSAPIDAGPNQCYVLGAWLRGEVDQEDAYNGWIVRLQFYDGGQPLSYEDAASGRWINPDWTYVEGRV